MAYPNSPCHGCERRTATCHSDCNEYSLYKFEIAEFRAIVKEAKDKERAIRDYEIKNYSKRRQI